jgi:hypothetical protein
LIANKLEGGDFGIWQSNAAGGDPSTAGTNRLNIKANGNVGIGTTGPSALLHLGIGSTAVVGQKIVLASGATANAFEVNSSSGTGGDKFVILANGNVGIGTTGPSALLDLNSAATTTNISNITATALTTGKAFNIASTTNDYTSGSLISASLTQAAATGTAVSGDIVNLAFSPTYSTDITTPAITGQVLDVSRSVTTNTDFASTLTLSGALAIFSDSATQTQGTLTSTADVVQILQNYSSNTGSALNITSAGTTGGYALRVNDNGTLTDSTPFVVDNSGNVGVGTTNPGRKLEVAGDMRLGTLLSGSGNAVYRDPTTGDLVDTSSSLKFKDNISDFGPVLEKLLALRTVRFTWNQNSISPGVADFGLVAEEVNQTLPDLVIYEADKQTPHGVKYEKLGLLAIKGIQEQETRLDELGNLVTASNAALATQSAQLSVANLEEKSSASNAALASVSAELASLKDQIALINAEVGVAAASANLTNLPNLDLQEATISGKLMVLGKTTLAEVGITGRITAGLLVIDGLSARGNPSANAASGEGLPLQETGADISTLAGPLKLQDLALGDLEMMGGKVTIDTKGNVRIAEGDLTLSKGKLTAPEIEAQKVKVESGLTLKDQITGKYYCVEVKNGEINREEGECQAASPTTTPTPLRPAPDGAGASEGQAAEPTASPTASPSPSPSD